MRSVLAVIFLLVPAVAALQPLAPSVLSPLFSALEVIHLASEELLGKVAAHAAADHQITDIGDDVLALVKAAIRQA